MKNIFILNIIFAISITITISCSKDDPVNPGNQEPLVTQVGTAFGTAVTASIDGNGGTLTSEDGFLILTIPAGAVSAATVFTIQALSNFCPGGMGRAYRLLPEGITFAQPITLNFFYADSLVSDVNFLAIAYQGTDQTWFAPKIISLHAVDHKISVQTKHFSDWSIFERLSIQPRKASVYINESVSLKVTFVGALNTITDAQGVELNNLNEDNTITTTWQAASGTFIKQGEDRANYTAPSTVPSQNPVDVSVTFNNVSITVNGHPYTNPKLFAEVNVYDLEAYFTVEFSSSLSLHPVGNNVFTITDYGSLKVLQQGDSVTVYDIRNFNAEVTPGILTDGGCTTTLLSPGDGWYNLPEGVHFFGAYSADFHAIFAAVDGQIHPTGTQASFEKVCTGGAPELIGGGVSTTLPSDFTFDTSLPYQEQVQIIDGGGIFPDGFFKMAVTKIR